jgi:antitoxin Phd
MARIATKARVLLVEDQTISLRDELERAGFSVTETRSVAAALGEMRSKEFDLVVGDLRLPSREGLTLLRQMKERSLDTPAVLMFERLDNASTLEATSLGAFQCLVRPVDTSSLKRVGELAAASRTRATARTGRPSVFRSRLRGRVVPTSVSATEAKNEFGRVLETALRSGAVVITRHEAPRAVLLAMDEFEELVGEGTRRLDTLSAEFDALLARMQAPSVRARMKGAFGATAAELGKAAVAAAKRHG